MISIARSVGPIGSERTAAPGPAWRTSASSTSRIVPKRSAPTLKVRGAGALAGADAGVGEVVRVDELVAVVAAAEDVDGPPRAHPLEEDLEDAEAAVAEDGARADDGHVERRDAT